MLNKIIFILGLLLLTSCDETYFEPNTPITQTDLSGTNWVVLPTHSLTQFDTITIHFISPTTYTIDTSTITYEYNVYTSYLNEDITFKQAPFFGNNVCSSIVPLGFKNSFTFYLKLRGLYTNDTISLTFNKL